MSQIITKSRSAEYKLGSLRICAEWIALTTFSSVGKFATIIYQISSVRFERLMVIGRQLIKKIRLGLNVIGDDVRAICFSLDYTETKNILSEKNPNKFQCSIFVQLPRKPISAIMRAAPRNPWRHSASLPWWRGAVSMQIFPFPRFARRFYRRAEYEIAGGFATSQIIYNIQWDDKIFEIVLGAPSMWHDLKHYSLKYSTQAIRLYYKPF